VGLVPEVERGLAHVDRFWSLGPRATTPTRRAMTGTTTGPVTARDQRRW
jgi:hypothetical protein